jgi:hypothetical protein
VLRLWCGPSGTSPTVAHNSRQDPLLFFVVHGSKSSVQKIALNTDKILFRCSGEDGLEQLLVADIM